MTFDPKTIKHGSDVQPYVKALLWGSTGSGKTTGALTAFATDGKVLLVDNEEGARHYGDTLNFDVAEGVRTPADILEVIRWLEDGDHDYNTLVIESMSVVYKDLQDEQQATGARKKGVKLDDYAMQVSDWMPIKRIHGRIVRAAQRLPMNVVMTAREKTDQEWRNNEFVVKGVLPDCEKSLPYDFDCVIHMLGKHDGQFLATVSDPHCKDRTNKLPEGHFEFGPGVFDRETVTRKAGKVESITKTQATKLRRLLGNEAITEEFVEQLKAHYRVDSADELTKTQAAEAITRTEAYVAEQAA